VQKTDTYSYKLISGWANKPGGRGVAWLVGKSNSEDGTVSRFKETLKDTPNGNTSRRIFSFAVGTSGAREAALFTYIAWGANFQNGLETGIHLGQWGVLLPAGEETTRDEEIPTKRSVDMTLRGICSRVGEARRGGCWLRMLVGPANSLDYLIDKSS
jgi:hypothetical protein